MIRTLIVLKKKKKKTFTSLTLTSREYDCLLAWRLHFQMIFLCGCLSWLRAAGPAERHQVLLHTCQRAHSAGDEQQPGRAVVILAAAAINLAVIFPKRRSLPPPIYPSIHPSIYPSTLPPPTPPPLLPPPPSTLSPSLFFNSCDCSRSSRRP